MTREYIDVFVPCDVDSTEVAEFISEFGLTANDIKFFGLVDGRMRFSLCDKDVLTMFKLRFGG